MIPPSTILRGFALEPHSVAGNGSGLAPQPNHERKLVMDEAHQRSRELLDCHPRTREELESLLRRVREMRSNLFPDLQLVFYMTSSFVKSRILESKRPA